MFRNFFGDRYGVDNLGIALLLVGTLLTRFNYIWILGYLMIGYALYRALSRDKAKRYAELQQFNRLLGKLDPVLQPVKRFFYSAFTWIAGRVRSGSARWNQRKNFIFFRCSNCGQNLRLPRGKGKIEVTCPKCRTKSIRKT